MGEIPNAIPSGNNARMVAAWLNNKMDITKRANPNNQGICVTICSIDPFNSVILPAINVSPIQANRRSLPPLACLRKNGTLCGLDSIRFCE